MPLSVRVSIVLADYQEFYEDFTSASPAHDPTVEPPKKFIPRRPKPKITSITWLSFYKNHMIPQHNSQDLALTTNDFIFFKINSTNLGSKLNVLGYSVPNRPGAPRGTAGMVPGGRGGWRRTGPLALVGCGAGSLRS